MITYRTLGNVELADTDVARSFSVLAHPKPVALLTYLVQASPSGFRRRDSLLAMFWPELDERRARRALNQALYRLRQELGEHAVVSRGQDEVGIQEGVLWSDVTAFRRAIEGRSWTEALDLYRGDLLPGFHLSGANDFEDWLAQERSDLRELAGEAAWAAASASAQQGLNVEAAKLARRAAGYVNEDEVALRRLLSFLGDLGDRAGALAAYAAFAERLDKEYGATPAPETQEVVAAIRASVVKEAGSGSPPGSSQTDDEEVLAKPATGRARKYAAPSLVGVEAHTAAATHSGTTAGSPRRAAWIGTFVAVAAAVALAVTVVLGRQPDAADPTSLDAYRYLDSLERSGANLVSWWPGDGNADDIAGSNPGTLVGNVTFAPSPVGQAFSFDGMGSAVTAADNNLPDGSSPRSVITWIKTSSGNKQLIVGYGTYAFPAARHDSYYLQVNTTLDCINGGPSIPKLLVGTSGPGSNVCGTTALNDGQWHHVSATFDGITHRVYVDGAIEGAGNPLTNTIRAGVMQIGSWQLSGREGDLPSDGLIDEVRFFDRELTAAEILADFLRGN